MKTFFKNFMIFCVGFASYQTIEGFWKVFITHEPQSFTMGLIGGVLFLLIGLLNNGFSWELPIWLQSIIGGAVITIIEFISGLVINKWLCPLMNRPLIWDYTGIPGNILGVVCPQYFFAWVFLATLCILIDDYLRYIVYDDKKPKCKFWF